MDLYEAVMQRDGFRCFHCAKTRNLQMHHLIPLSSGGENTEDNCIMLCIDCHAGVHNNHPDLHKYLCSGSTGQFRYDVIKTSIDRIKRKNAFKI